MGFREIMQAIREKLPKIPLIGEPKSEEEFNATVDKLERFFGFEKDAAKAIGSLLTPWQGLVIFMLFIMEETLQAVNFAIWQAMNAKEWQMARSLIAQGEPMLVLAEQTNDKMGLTVPFAREAFGAYYGAVRLQFDSYKEIIDRKEREEASGRKAGIKGGVFDMR